MLYLQDLYDPSIGQPQPAKAPASRIALTLMAPNQQERIHLAVFQGLAFLRCLINALLSVLLNSTYKSHYVVIL
jgi:hypothetical protein